MRMMKYSKRMFTSANLKFSHVEPNQQINLRMFDPIQVSKDALVCKAEFIGAFNNYYIAPGLHLSIYSNLKVGNSFLSKRYTPLEYLDPKTISILIKVYQNEKGENVGRVGSYIYSSIQNSTQLKVDFPYGKIAYVNDTFFHKKESGNAIISSIESWTQVNYSKLGFIAAGTGITPIYRIIKELLQSKTKRDISLLFLNNMESELYFKEELIGLAKQNNISLRLLATKETKASNDLVACAQLSEDIIKNFFQPPNPDFAIYSCGSKIMINNFVEPTLSKLNYINYSF